MSTSGIDPQAQQNLRDRLLHQAQAAAIPEPAAQVDWSLPQSTLVAEGGNSTQRLSDAVNTLKRRSLQMTQSTYPAGPLEQLPSAPPAEIRIYQQRLTAMAERINQLSQQQLQAMAEMQTLQKRLAQANSLGHGAADIPQVDFRQAAVTWVVQNATGQIGFTSQPMAQTQMHTDAQALAQTLRQRHLSSDQAEAMASSAPFKENQGSPTWATLLQEPLALGQDLWDFIVDVLRSPPAAAPRPRRSRGLSRLGPLSAVDAVIWVGGGVIGRLALNLALAAFPWLWPVAVVLITLCTALALYQATLAPRPDFGLAYRVFLAIAGLILAGRFL